MAANPQSDDLHGIYMTEEAFERLISVESPYRYELIDGVVYDMTGSTPEHKLCLRIFRAATSIGIFHTATSTNRRSLCARRLGSLSI